MSRPGARLRATLARHCDEKIMRQCIDPIIADLQAEYRSARNEGRVWHSRRIRFAGYASVLEVAVMCVWRGSLSAITEWPAVDLQALRRTVGWFGLVTLAGTLVILTPEYWKYAAVERFPVASLLYLMPYALSIALPLGLMVGIGAGLGRGPRSPRIAVSVIWLPNALIAVAATRNFTRRPFLTGA